MADINLSRVGWQNGTLVSKAKVEINGTIYEVEPEEYSGTTPLSAENLKQMEDNTEDAINEVNDKIEPLITYSTNEINTGKKWINGKDIYSKSFIVGSLPNDTTRFMPHNILNFERLTGLEASWYDSEDNRWYYDMRPGENARIVFTANNVNVIIQASGANWSDRTSGCVVTLEYTKTTD